MKKTLRFAALAAAASLIMVGCTTNEDSKNSSSTVDCKPSDGKVELNFTSWVPGIEKVVEIWNKENPDIKVKAQTGPSGNAGTYQNFFNQLEAGNAPDIGQIEYDTIPNFRVQDGLYNLAECEGLLDSEDKFVPWTWGQVTFGEEDSLYGVPQDAGPMGLYYRKDLFEKNNIPVPTTWDEYKAAAEKIASLGGKITNFSDSDINQFAGFAWQADAKWFSNDGDKWDVSITDDETLKVANYWQSLLDADLLGTYPAWTTEWNNAYDKGEIWTWNSAVWGANTIKSGAPSTEGNWAVAPMPQWNAGGQSAGNWGGSANVVFSGSDHPYEAAKFILWLNTSEEALTALNKEADLYPASVMSESLSALQEGVPFYGDQPIYQEFAKYSNNVSKDFVWGPTMTKTYSSISDGFKKAIAGDGTLADALKKGEEQTIKTMKSKSIPVAE